MKITGIIEIMSLRTTIDDQYTFENIVEFLKDFLEKGLSNESEKSTFR